MRRIEIKRDGNRIKMKLEKTAHEGEFIDMDLSESEAALLYMKLKLILTQRD